MLLLCLAVAAAFVVACRRPAGASSTAAALPFRPRRCSVALLSLGAAPSSVTLPLGLPWTGAHFRLDPLAAFFLVVVGLGSAGASLYALGYGRHEHEPQRVLPFYPAFLAGLESRGRRRRCVQLPVRLGADVASLLGAGDVAPSREQQRPRRLRLHHHGKLLRPGAAAVLRPACRPDRRLRLRRDARRAPDTWDRRARPGACADRCRIQGRRRAAARLAAARASRRTEPRVGADERGDDQGRGLRLRAHRLRSARPARLVVWNLGAGGRRHHRRARRAVRADGARPEAAARLSHGREHRHHLHRPRPGAGLRRQSAPRRRGARADRRAVPRVQPLGLQEPAVLRLRRGAHRDRRARHGSSRRPDPPHAEDRRSRS